MTLMCIVVVTMSYALRAGFHFIRNPNTALYLSLPFAFLYYRRIIAEDLQKMMFVFCLALHATGALTGARLPINLLAGAIAEDKERTDILIEFFMIMSRIIYYPFVIWIIQRYMTPRLKSIEPENMKWLWIVPAAFSFIAVSSYQYHVSQSAVYFFWVIYVPLNIQAFVVYILTLGMLDNVMESAHVKEENLALEHVSNMKTELMSTVSNEARTPLAVLASYAGLVSMELKDKGLEMQTAANLDKVVFEAKRVAGLIDGMNKLTLRGGGTARRVSLDVGDVIRQTAGLFRYLLERDGAEPRLHADKIDNNLPAVFGSPEELTQVLFNLLQNARKATTEGTIAVSAERRGEYIAVTAEDTGGGIAPELLPRLFERGVSGDDGTGLGLAICRNIIESHGGTISVESEENKGTKVTFTLPIYEGRDYDGQ